MTSFDLYSLLRALRIPPLFFSTVGINTNYFYRALIGCPIAGAFLSKNRDSFTPLIVFSGCTMLVGSIFIIGSRLAIDRNLLARV